ncbi:hypothetical protein ABB55_17130 [Prosthecomicrobium hirschii]|uniref:Uncharacterized protein n=1 Tax=Prosthecodimorpha hirschii TaxID=665126 RepID=A0A0P6VPF5_9HYPH|nr:hypothetical protein [Prosthecomicrobium hirschii]KPL53722.1 hypothetical protein ABB55_17130 [Prosthecomicrobium hirschii]
MIVFRLLWRFIVITVGYLAAAAAAAAFAAASQVLSHLPPEFRDAAEIWRSFGPLADFGAFLVAYAIVLSVSFVPGILLALVSEIIGLRSLGYYLVAGGLIGLWAARPPIGGIAAQPFAPALAAGFVGGFVYWLIAGRGAGRSRPASAAPSGQGPVPDPRRTGPHATPPPSPPPAHRRPASAVPSIAPSHPGPRRPPPPSAPPRPPVVDRKSR